MIGYRKDGGPNSKVDGWFFEIKKLFTIALLRFNPGSREAYHSHAFDCISLILGPGHLEEVFYDGKIRFHKSGKVLITKKDDFHKVYSHGTTYVLTLRGPWEDTWEEIVGDTKRTLTHGRNVVKEEVK